MSIFPGGSDGKASAYNAGDLGSIPRSGRFPGEGNDTPLKYTCLGNRMDSSCEVEELDTTEHSTHRHGLTGSWNLQVWTTFESPL